MKSSAVGACEVEALIPHRAPFRFVDEVEIADGKILGKRTFPAEEFFFAGHFPGYPVVPGVILIETMAQVGGVGVKLMGINESGTFLLATVKDARFRRQVRPGETFRVVVENLRASPKIIRQRGMGYIGDELAVEAEWLAIAGNGASGASGSC